MYTTLNKIRACEPGADRGTRLLESLGKTKAGDKPLNIKTILESNGLDDALWCLRAVEGKDKEIRLYAVWCARQVQHLMTDKRSLDALDVAERFANGLASEEELKIARGDAWAASSETSSVMAQAAAWSAAWATSRKHKVAEVTAWAAARTAAMNAAYAALGTALEAAYAAAWSERAAALDAATEATTKAARAVWAAAQVAAKEAQAKKLIEICEG